MEDHYEQVAALGRQFKLGTLYDCRDDTYYLTGDPILWHASYASAIRVKSHMKQEILCPDSGSNKLHHVGLGDHMQIGVLTGLVRKFQGASKYLNERKNPTEATRTIVCRVTIKEELVHAPLLKKNIIQRLPTDGTIEATHVIVGIVYGAEAYCVLSHKLDGDLDDEDAREEAEEYLSKITLKMKNSLDENQSATAFLEQFDEEEQKQVNRMLKCRLYVDFQSTRNCDVFHAYKCCRLISVDRVTDESVPIAFKTCSLNVILNRPNIAKLFHLFQVDLQLLPRCHFIMGELERIIAQVEIIRKDVDKPNRKSLRHFQKAVAAYKELVRETYKESLVIARKTGNSEVLEKAVKITEKHPDFHPSRLENWIKYKQIEMDLVKKIKSIDEVTYLASVTLLNKTLADCFEKKHALVLTVPSFAEKTDTVLRSMESYINSCGNLLDDLDRNFYLNADDRLPMPAVAEWMRKEFVCKIREMVHFARMNKDLKDQVQFFVISGPSGCKFTFSYSIYEADCLLTNEDNRVQLPYPPTGLRILPAGMCDKSLDAVIVEWKYGNLHYPCQFLVEYRVKGTSEKAWNRRQVTKPLATQTNVSFKKGSAMEIRVAAVTCIGRSEFSDIIETVSQPEIPSGDDAAESRFAKKERPAPPKEIVRVVKS